MRIGHVTTLACRVFASLLLATAAGCGGGDFAELFVKLISARFVPASVTLAAGTSTNVELEVICDRAGLDTVFGRLGIRVTLDPSRVLPPGVTATFSGGPPAAADGSHLFPCTGATSDPELRIAHLPVVVVVAPGTTATSATLRAFIDVEPLVATDPSKDSTLADLGIRLSGSISPGQ